MASEALGFEGVLGLGFRARIAVTVAVAILLGWLAAGCRTPGAGAAVNLAEPGWRVRQGQAVWRVGKTGPELAGELLLATHADGRVWLEFTKSPLSLVRCRVDGAGWEAVFPARGRRVAGRGAPPRSIGWLVLVDCVGGKAVPAGWSFERREEQGWRLAAEGTGEVVEGFLAP